MILIPYSALGLDRDRANGLVSNCPDSYVVGSLEKQIFGWFFVTLRLDDSSKMTNLAFLEVSTGDL